MFKIVWKKGQPLNLPGFRIIFDIFAKLMFALKFNIWVWQIIFIKFLSDMEKGVDAQTMSSEIANPTWEGVQILWIGGGGANSAPPKKSMKELCQTPGCYIEVWPI